MPKAFEIIARVKDKVSRPVRDMGQAFVRFGKVAITPFRAIFRVLTSLKSLVVGVVGVLAVRSLFDLTKSTAETTAQFGKWADKLNVTSEELSRLTASTRALNIEDDILFEGLKTLQERIEDAATGGATYLEHFNRLGVAVRNADGSIRRVAEVVPDLARAYQQAAARGETLTLATEDLIGGSENVLELWLRQGPEAIQRAGELAGLLNGLVTEEQITSAVRLGGAIRDFRTAFDGFARDILVEFGEGIARGFDAATQLLVQNKDVIFTLIRGIGGVLKTGIVLALGLVKAVAQGIQVIFNLSETLEAAARSTSNVISRTILESLAQVSRVIRDVFPESPKGLQEFLGAIEDTAAGVEGVISEFQRLFIEQGFTVVAQKLADSANTARDAWLGFFTGLRGQAAKLGEELRSLSEEGAQVADSIAGNLTTAIVDLQNSLAGVGDETRSVGRIFKDFARAVLVDIQRIIARMIALQILSAGIGGLFGGGGGGAGAGAGTRFLGPSVGGSPQAGGVGGLGSPDARILNSRAAGGGPLPDRILPDGGGQRPNFTINLNAIDGPSVQRFLQEHGDSFLDWIRRALQSDPEFRREILPDGGATA